MSNKKPPFREEKSLLTNNLCRKEVIAGSIPLKPLLGLSSLSPRGLDERIRSIISKIWEHNLSSRASLWSSPAFTLDRIRGHDST